MKPYISIDGRKIGPDFALISVLNYLLQPNHNGDINRAFRLWKRRKKAGADAIKLQTYTHETITMDCDSEEFQIHGGLWDGQTLYNLYKGAHMPWEWHKPLFEKAKELGITIFSPFRLHSRGLIGVSRCPSLQDNFFWSSWLTFD